MSNSNIVTPAGFDKSSFGEVVELSSPNGITLKIVEKGLHVAAIKFKDVHGFEHDIIPGSDDPKEYVDERKFRHSLIGRYCNRLPSDKPLPIPSGSNADSTTITLPSYPSKGQTLHGGPSPAGWDEKVLHVVVEPTMFSPAEKEVLSKARKEGRAEIWELESPDGEGGHVGTIRAEVAFLSLPPKEGANESQIGRVIVIYRAKVIDAPATALNLTQHWGFNLDASSLSKGHPKPASDVGIYDHNLSLLTKNILNLDPVTSLPTGTLLPLSTPSASKKDFGQPGGKSIGRKGEGYPRALEGEDQDKMGQGYPGEGYDDFWVFDRKPVKGLAVQESELSSLNVFAEMDADSQTVATLSSPLTGLSLEFKTNQPGMQAWSGTGGFDGSDARKKIHGGNSKRGSGDGYVGAAGLAMEFHAIYGAWMHPELEPLGWNTILRKGEVYNNWVEMTVSSK